MQHIERYRNKVAVEGRRIVPEYDKIIKETGKLMLAEKAKEELAAMAKEAAAEALGNVLPEASRKMKNGCSRADN